MAVYIVTWNLNLEKEHYSEARDNFINSLEKFDNIDDPGLESVRFISTKFTARQVSAFLRQSMDANDRLFVSKINRFETSGWLRKRVWDWIRERR